MFLSFALWVQSLEFFAYLRASRIAYPVILGLHMVALGLFGAMILVTNLRLLGWNLAGMSIPEILDQLRIPKRIGLTLMAGCGILLFCSKAEQYYHNVFFQTKLVLFALLIAHSLFFRQRVYYNAAPLSSDAKLAGALSLVLWVALVCAGRSIGYVEPPFLSML